MNWIGLILSLSIIISACSKGPKEIDYTNENCHFCEMTIMDARFGSEIVTDKGKAFKYCSIECMARGFNRDEKLNNDNVSLFLVKDYEAPGEFLKTEEAFFLISSNMPSPMGEGLNAFLSKSSAEKYLDENGGNIYSWNEIVELIK